jgi:hypothetical protein
MVRRWFTPQEGRLLLRRKGGLSTVAQQLCRRRLATLSRRMEGTAADYRQFTSAEDDLIRDGRSSVTELANQFGRTPLAVSIRFKRLGVKAKNPRKRVFSPAEDAMILANSTKSHSEIARILDRDRSSVRKRRKMLVERANKKSGRRKVEITAVRPSASGRISMRQCPARRCLTSYQNGSSTSGGQERLIAASRYLAT